MAEAAGTLMLSDASLSWLNDTSWYGGRVDLLFVGLVLMALSVTFLLFILLLGFAIHYRKGSRADRDHRIKKSWRWEISWTTATFVAFLILFIWGASLYLTLTDAPSDALPIYVVAKQWMWKIQHPAGQREINELHVPAGKAIRLVLTSQDVIHSFFLPSFRIKQDVVPGRYQQILFQPERAGVFPLVCSEFCGTDHAAMAGRVVVLEPENYASWLVRQDGGGTLASEGAVLFRELGCSGCHAAGSGVRAPELEGFFGKPVPLRDGTIAIADEAFVRDSILLPQRQLRAGYKSMMPSYQGRVSEDELLRLVAYIKALGNEARTPP